MRPGDYSKRRVTSPQVRGQVCCYLYFHWILTPFQRRKWGLGVESRPSPLTIPMGTAWLPSRMPLMGSPSYRQAAGQALQRQTLSLTSVDDSDILFFGKSGLNAVPHPHP